MVIWEGAEGNSHIKHFKATYGELCLWRSSPHGALPLLLHLLLLRMGRFNATPSRLGGES